MTVEWPVANLDFEALRPNSGRQKDTRRNDDQEEKFIFDHYTLMITGAPPVANAFLVAGNTS